MPTLSGGPSTRALNGAALEAKSVAGGTPAEQAPRSQGRLRGGGGRSRSRADRRSGRELYRGRGVDLGDVDGRDRARDVDDDLRHVIAGHRVVELSVPSGAGGQREAVHRTVPIDRLGPVEEVQVRGQRIDLGDRGG